MPDNFKHYCAMQLITDVQPNVGAAPEQPITIMREKDEGNLTNILRDPKRMFNYQRMKSNRMPCKYELRMRGCRGGAVAANLH